MGKRECVCGMGCERWEENVNTTYINAIKYIPQTFSVQVYTRMPIHSIDVRYYCQARAQLSSRSNKDSNNIKQERL